jgi:hypothetical protein
LLLEIALLSKSWVLAYCTYPSLNYTHVATTIPSSCRSYHVRLELPSAKNLEPLSKATRSKTDKTPLDACKKSVMTYAVMVAPPNAKPVKKKLQDLGWLDKRFRMTKLSSSQIAIPVNADAWHELRKQLGLETTEESWYDLILDQGQQEMPFSTAQFAAKGKR